MATYEYPDSLFSLEEMGAEEEEVIVSEPTTEDDFKLNNENIIRNLSYDQSEILYNIMNLYNDGKPFDCDITASSLKFYEGRNNTYGIPTPKHLFDVFPKDDRITKITPFHHLPIEDNSLTSIVCDLPFCISPKTCKSMTEGGKNTCIIANRFSSWYPYMEGYENMFWWIKECYDKLCDGGILIWKMQNTVSGGINHWYTYFSFLAAQKFGFYVIDEFILAAKARLISSGKIKKQAHARKFTSTFWVFKKDNKNAEKTNCMNIFEECLKNVYEGKEWEFK